MSIQYAQDIVRRLGPGSIALDRAAYADLAVELALVGCAVHDLASAPVGAAVLLDWTGADDGATTLARAAPFETLVLRPGDSVRQIVEPALFAHGWRRHPGGMLPGDAADWSDTHLPSTCYYQRAPGDETCGPLCGSDGGADGFIARYAQASQHVRAGDHVLIDGLHAREGAEILAALSRGARFMSDVPPASAEAIFRLDHIADRSIDLVVAFEPPADDWRIALAEYARVLRPDGRLIAGWRRRDGMAALPEHWPALIDFAEQLFVPESRYAQHERDRALYPVDLDGPESEWMILVAAADPLDGATSRDAFTHPAFPGAGPDGPVLVDFGRAYDNPWLYRSMVQMGERIAEPVKLARLAECVIADSRPESADRGAALGVLGYRVLELRMREASAPLLERIEAYLMDTDSEGQPPHVVRWRLSLAFLAGRLCELAEQRAPALAWYDRCAAMDWSRFSPILATKTIAACFHGARLCIAAHDMEGATARFRLGVETGHAVAAADHRAQMGAPESPLPFYFQELAEVIDMASQCANALANLPLFARDPGLFWRQVDVRRFGLATWALDVQRENDRLRRLR